MRYLFAHFLQTIDVLDTGKRCRPYCANLSFPSAFFLWKVNNFRWLLHPKSVLIDRLSAGLGLISLILCGLYSQQTSRLVYGRKYLLKLDAEKGYSVDIYNLLVCVCYP